ncbi:FecR family protein [Gimesia aquarii]|uniref:FecR protein n=1 Tax=Gimesia aquarii TaxID=2527964 RepID=A0A517VT08_9PLAN|nr:FecR domain-containing protein [Gimesia aquarii]QDT96147.1 FecR protein [Gimesia aquarii]
MTVHELPPNFDRLLNQLIDGKISKSEFEELEQYLSSTPEAMQTYFDYLDIQTGVQKSYVERLKELDQIFTDEVPQTKPASKAPVFRRNTKLFSMLSYLAVATASVSLMLFAEKSITGRFIWEPIPAVNIPRITEPKDLPYVATLTRSNNCVWGGDTEPLFSGQRLLTKDLYLETGTAEFRFDSGIRLVLKGPTKIHINSANSAIVDSGEVVLHGYESAPEFALTTPQATFFDIGTEYGTKVEDNGDTELHVFQGSVRVEPSGKSKDLIVNQGKARDITKNKDIPLELTKFQREVPGKPRNAKKVNLDELIAYDSFHPSKIITPEELSEWQRGGIGWETHWRNHKNWSGLAVGNSYPTKSLVPKELSPNQLGCVEIERGKIGWRTLKKPVRLDIDAIYYISFFIQKRKWSPAIDRQYGNISLWNLGKSNEDQKNAKKILFGISSNRFPSLRIQTQTVEKAPPLEDEKPYFFVGKIVASEKSPDQIFLRVFSGTEKIPEQEPHIWTCTTDPFYDSTVFDHVRIFAGRNSKYLFDELHIGTTWESVVNFNDPDPPKVK